MLQDRDGHGKVASGPRGPETGEAHTAEPPFERIAGDAARGLVLVCDHAGNAFPPGYGTLGLDARECARHIAYDIGAAEVTRAMAAALGAPAVLGRYSRLLIDLNRGVDDPTLIMQLSDGAVVPGNRQIDQAEREKRIRLFYEPYHAAVDQAIDAALAAGVVPVILSVHSFTDVWRGTPRPWHVTVLWDKDPRLVRPLLERLSAEPSLTVAENVPYSGELEGDCMNRHGTRRGLAHALVEIRQDLIRNAQGQREWAARLSAIMAEILADPALVQELRRIAHRDAAGQGARDPDGGIVPAADRIAAR